MEAIQKYLHHAEECEALARTAVSEEQRQQIEKMAETWRMLARQRERHIRSKAHIDAIGASDLSPASDDS